jgi:hypothetical protein
MFSVLTLGVLSSVATELVTWINKKLSGTVLKGNGAFLLAGAVAIVGAAIKVFATGVPLNDWGGITTAFAQVWTVSQVFFLVVVQTLGLDVSSTTSAA